MRVSRGMVENRVNNTDPVVRYVYTSCGETYMGPLNPVRLAAGFVCSGVVYGRREGDMHKMIPEHWEYKGAALLALVLLGALSVCIVMFLEKTA